MVGVSSETVPKLLGTLTRHHDSQGVKYHFILFSLVSKLTLLIRRGWGGGSQKWVGGRGGVLQWSSNCAFSKAVKRNLLTTSDISDLPHAGP